MTRAQVVKLMALSRGWLTPPGPGTPTPAPTPPTWYSDVPPGHWAYDFVQAATARGVINGYADGRFVPNGLASRAQMAKMIYLMMQR